MTITLHMYTSHIYSCQESDEGESLPDAHQARLQPVMDNDHKESWIQKSHRYSTMSALLHAYDGPYRPDETPRDQLCSALAVTWDCQVESGC